MVEHFFIILRGEQPLTSLIRSPNYQRKRKKEKNLKRSVVTDKDY